MNFLMKLALVAAACGPWGAAAQVVKQPEPEEIVVLGDELAAGYGLPGHAMFASILLREIKRENLRYQVRTAAGTGDGTRMGSRRMPIVLKVPRLKVVIVALGYNDAKTKAPVDEMRRNLGTIIEHCASNKVGVVLCGFRLPPGDDLEYAAGFSSVFPEVARAYRVPFVTNLLAGVEGVAEMNLNDGVHPNKEGQKRIAENVWSALGPLLRSMETGGEEKPPDDAPPMGANP